MRQVRPEVLEVVDANPRVTVLVDGSIRAIPSGLSSLLRYTKAPNGPASENARCGGPC